MVDKKTSAIVVLCVVTVLCLGLWANEAQEVSRLKGGLSELEVDYEKLARVRTSLEENYSELRTEKEDLETEYSNLEAAITSLEKSYSILHAESQNLILAIQETNSLLMNNYSTLKEDYSMLYSRYNSLKEDYDVIIENYDKLLIELENFEKEHDYFERAVDAARTAITWECLESWRGIADTDGNLHFVTKGIYVRSEIVKISYNTFGGRYDTFEVQIHAVSDGQITQEARWDVHPHGALWTGIMWGEAYPLVVSREVYYLEITGKYTEDFMQKLEGGMGFIENLAGRDYDYTIGLSIPADLSP